MPADAGPGASVGVMAEIHAVLGKLSGQMDRREARDRETERLLAQVHTVAIQTAIPLDSSGDGTIHYADMLGPKDGYHWDVRRIALDGFTAGTVKLYKGSVNSTLIAEWTQTGEWTWSTGLVLNPRDNLVFEASGITGNVTIDGTAVEVQTSWWGQYLT